MERHIKIRRIVAVVVAVVGFSAVLLQHPDLRQQTVVVSNDSVGEAADVLDALAVKGRAPKTDYSRSQFGNGWAIERGCNTRDVILYRDLKDAAINGECKVMSGTLNDPYTGKEIIFQRGAGASDDVQIDHVVALSDAWQKGAQQLTAGEREQLANDPLELLAVDGPANQQKSDGDAATWLPANKSFRCQYVARQIAIKQKYSLWITQAEKESMVRVLSACPGQQLPSS
jgi:hypothetical protein